MKALRRLALVALGLSFVQIVFGAIVRITGSGMGCGDHWPKCNGRWIPPMDNPEQIIEVMHRYLALAVGVALLALLVVAWTRRGRQAGVAGPGGVLRATLLALGLYALIANVGRIIVQLGLHPWVIAAHLVLAMSLIATIAAALIRAGGLGALAAARQKIAPSTRRTAHAAAGLGIVVVAMGALTANLPGASGACLGFPACTQAYITEGGGAHVQLTHRVLALLLLLHLIGMVFAVRKRGEVGAVTTALRVSLGLVVAQIVVAAALVSLALPPFLKSLHQALGTLVWLALFVLAALSRLAATREPAPAEAPAPDPGARSDDPHAGRARGAGRAPARPPVTVPATAAQATVAFVATTGPNARMVRVSPDDDAGFAAAEAGGLAGSPDAEPPPPDEPMPDVPALAETGSWSVSDLSIGLPPDAEEHLRGDDPERGDDEKGKDDHGPGPVTAYALPFVAAALMASPGDALANAESHESAAVHDAVAMVSPASVAVFQPFTSPPVAPDPAVGSPGDAGDQLKIGVAPATVPRRPPSLAVIIARGAMS